MEQKEKIWLLIIFLVVLATRLFLAFQIPNFTYDSYFNLRQVERISETGLPLYEDDLSYGGRVLKFLPFFHYFMAFFDLFLPLTIVAKIIPNFLLASLTLIVFLLSRKITQNRNACFFSAIIAGFLPILYAPNSFTVDTLFLPLAFLTTYLFFNIEKKQNLYWYLICFLILSFTSSATFLIIMGFGIYLLLSVLEQKKILRKEVEIILFSFFFFLWIQFLFFREILLDEGLSFIWQNIPRQIIQQYFPTLSVMKMIVLISVIPLLAGVYVVYHAFFKLKNENSFLLISFVLSTIILALLKLIEFKVALAFLAIIVAILFSTFNQNLNNYLKKTKLYRFQEQFEIALVLLLILTMIFPAMSYALEQDTPSDKEIKAFQWLEQNTPPNAKVLALLEEGHLITYYGKRKNVMDNNFALIENTGTKFADLNRLFTTDFLTEAIGLCDDYEIRYLLFTPYAAERFQRGNFKYHTIDCFNRVYKDDEEEIRIYEVRCTLNAMKEQEENKPNGF